MKAHEILEELGFCGCGRPESAAEYLRDGLKILADMTNKREVSTTNAELEAMYATFRAETEALHRSEGCAYFFYYWLDQQGFLEHGGSVPGWMTAEGFDLLEKLQAADYSD